MMGSSPYTVYVDVNSGRRSSRFGQQLVSNRMGALIASLAVTMLVALALSGSDEGSGLAIKSAKLSQAKINGFSPKQMANMEQMYAKDDIMKKLVDHAVVGLPPAVANLAKTIAAKARRNGYSLKGARTSQLDEAVTKPDCNNKATYTMISDKFTSLVSNLISLKATRQSEYDGAKTSKESAYTAYLNSESAFRTAETDHNTAKLAATYAEGEYKKYKEAATAARTAYPIDVDPMKKEKNDLSVQLDMITQITQLLAGMASPTSSKKSKVANLAQINSDIAQLDKDPKFSKEMKEQALEIKKITESLQTTELDSATLGDAMKILSIMSTDITTRITSLDASIDAADKNLAALEAQELKWQQDVVKLNDDKDKAESKKNSADLERGTLSGEYTAKLNAFNDIARKFTPDMAQLDTEIGGVNAIVSTVQNLVVACTTR